jgi:hypothetical protein
VREPWSCDLPMLLPPGRVATNDGGATWWRAQGGGLAFPLIDLPEGVIRATDLERCAAIWSNGSLRLLAAHTVWGPLHHVG